MLRIVSFVIALSMVTTPALAETLIIKCPWVPTDSTGPVYKYESSFFGLGAGKFSRFYKGTWRPFCGDKAMTNEDFAFRPGELKDLILEVNGKTAKCTKVLQKSDGSIKRYGHYVSFDVFQRGYVEGSSKPTPCRLIPNPQ